MIPHRPGQRLPNGTILLDEVIIETKRNGAERYSVVLAVAETHRSLANPFVTWDRRVTNDAPTATGGIQVVDTTIWGHYHESLEEAISEFNWRVVERREGAGV